MLESERYLVQVDLNQPGYVRAIVRKGKNATFWTFSISTGTCLCSAPIDIHALKKEWLEALDDVESFVASRPPEEIGCLYYSASRRGFVDPREASDPVPHFGRPGGVLPRIAEG